MDMRSIMQVVEGRFDDESTYQYGAQKSAAEYASHVWYHGSEEDFDEFQDGHGRYFALWFAENPKLTGYYGANQYKVRLNMRNPLIVSEQEYAAAKPNGPTYWAKEAANGGHDAVIIQDIIDGDTESTVCGVLDPKIIQIVDKDVYVDEDAAFPLRKGVLDNVRGNYGALVAVMDPKDFIRLTTTSKEEYNQIFRDKFASLAAYRNETDPEFNKSRYNMPYLIVDYDTGKVMGHEGRHRAAMVAKEGGTRYPCYLMFRNEPKAVTLSYSQGKKDDPDHDESVEKSFATYDELEAFKDELLRLRDDDDHPYWYSMFQSHRDAPMKMKGSPRSNPSNWEYDAWKPDDMPDQLVGQYDSSVVVPKSRIKVGVVKGYRHFK